MHEQARSDARASTSSPDAMRTSNRLAGIEGLRGVAALLVVVTHTRQRLTPDAGPAWFPTLIDLSSQGLTLFFALSGFLLFLPFASALIRGGELPNLKRYFRNRVLRIFPAYLVIFAIAAFALGLVYTRASQPGEVSVGGDQPVGRMTDPLMILANLTLTQTLFPETLRTGITPAWSLAAELSFYLLLPLSAAIAMLARRTIGAKALWIPPGLLLVVGVVSKLILNARFAGADDETRWWLEWGGNWTAVFAKSICVQADLFAFGMIAAAVMVLVGEQRMRRRSAAIAGTIGLIVGLGSFPLAHGVGFGDTSFGIFFSSVILITALGVVSAEVTFLESFPLRWAGLTSYSIYLWHTPVLLAFQQHWNPFPQTVLGFLLALVVVCLITVALSILTYKFIEVPALSLKRPQVERSLAVEHLGTDSGPSNRRRKRNS